MTTIRRLGPVEIPIGNHLAEWTGNPSELGVRGFALRGSLRDPEAARALLTLVDNPPRRISVAGHTGVLAYLHADGPYDVVRGWVLLTAVRYVDGPNDADADAGWGPVSIDGSHLGWSYEPVIVRSSTPIDNDQSLASRSLVVQPWWGANADGEPFIADPGGIALVREYDATTLPAADTDVEARKLHMRRGTVTSSTDDLATIVRVGFQHTGSRDAENVDGEWVRLHGGECRAYDRREGQLVLGPGHAFRVPSDCVLTNGLVRAWVGQWGAVPYVAVEAFNEGAWHEVGSVIFDEVEASARLQRARIVRCRSDDVVVALDASEHGPIFVGMRIGERMLRVTHGDSLTPAPATTRQVEWIGMPPWEELPGTFTQPAGKFGQALEYDAGLATWNISQLDPHRWGFCGYWLPGVSSEKTAPVWRSTEVATGAGVTSLVVTKPAGTIEGDLLLAFVAFSGDPGTITPPAGWTEIRADGTNVRMRSYWLVAGASEPADYTWSWTNSVHALGEMSRITGHDPANPIDTHNGQGGSAVDPVAPAVTTTQVTSLLVAACVQDGDHTFTSPGGYTERWDHQVGAILLLSASGATKEQAAKGGSGDATFDSTAVLAQNYAAQLVAVRSTQLDSGIVQINSATDSVAKLEYLAASKTLRLRHGDEEISSSVLSFDADEPVFWAITFDARVRKGLGLTVDDGTIQHVSDISLRTVATDERRLDRINIGVATGDGSWGSGNWADDNWGGVAAYAGGAIDEVKVFDGFLTEDERAALAAASSALDGLPSPEGRMVLRLSFDLAPAVDGSALTSGRRFEATAEGGSTRQPLIAGLTRAVATLDVSPLAPTGLRLRKHTNTRFRCGAILATTVSLDDLVDYHELLATENRQSVRLR